MEWLGSGVSQPDPIPCDLCVSSADSTSVAGFAQLLPDDSPCRCAGLPTQNFGVHSPRCSLPLVCFSTSQIPAASISPEGDEACIFSSHFAWLPLLPMVLSKRLLRAGSQRDHRTRLLPLSSLRSQRGAVSGPIFLSSAGNQTQALEHARQAPHH